MNMVEKASYNITERTAGEPVLNGCSVFYPGLNGNDCRKFSIVEFKMFYQSLCQIKFCALEKPWRRFLISETEFLYLRKLKNIHG